MRSQFVTSNRQWYFAIIDVIAVLTQSADANAYWRKLKERLKKEGNETVTKCNALKMTAADGKQRLADVANTEQLLRLIQYIPSPKAERFKVWLARFPAGFSFVSKNKELIDLMFQLGRSSSHSGRSKPPRVSTEYGAMMASSGKTPNSPRSAEPPLGFSSFFHPQSNIPRYPISDLRSTIFDIGSSISKITMTYLDLFRAVTGGKTPYLWQCRLACGEPQPEANCDWDL